MAKLMKKTMESAPLFVFGGFAGNGIQKAIRRSNTDYACYAANELAPRFRIHDIFPCCADTRLQFFP